MTSLARALLGDRYEVVTRLGAGQIGETFVVRPRRGAPCLLRQLAEPYVLAYPQLIRRAPFDVPLHPNLLPVLDSWVEPATLAGEEDRGCIVQALGFGRSLKEATAGADHRILPPLEVACRIVAQAARGVAAVHAVGRVLGPTKPSRVLLGRDGRVQVEMLTAEAMARPVSRQGPQGMWSFLFHEPAVLRVEAIHDATSDVYTLGAMLWELTVGPRGSRSLMTALDWLTEMLRWRVVTAKRPPSLPPAVGRVLDHALDEDRARRASAEEVAVWLEEIAPPVAGAGDERLADWLASREATLPPARLDALRFEPATYDEVEQSFLDKLTLPETDDVRATRVVYGDWLAERGEADKSAYLRLVLEAPARPIVEHARRTLERELDPRWCRLVRGSVCLLEP